MSDTALAIPAETGAVIHVPIDWSYQEDPRTKQTVKVWRTVKCRDEAQAAKTREIWGITPKMEAAYARWLAEGAAAEGDDEDESDAGADWWGIHGEGFTLAVLIAAPRGDRKALAMYVNGDPDRAPLAAYVFALADGRDIDPLIYRRAFDGWRKDAAP